MAKRGIVLSLEPRLDQHVRELWASFQQAGVGITPGQLLESPHITIAEASSTSFEPLWEAVVETKFPDKSLQLIQFGAFFGKKNIIFYNVILSEGLGRSYLSYYESLRQKKAAYKALYDPSHILFHSTVAVEIESAEFPRAIELFAQNKASLAGCAAAVELWEHFPAKLVRRREL
jgi:hypothetical protein